jgi:hypothetical protein
MKKVTSRDALDRVIHGAMMDSLTCSKRGRPVGFFVKLQKDEMKEALEQLTSADVADVAPWQLKICIEPRHQLFGAKVDWAMAQDIKAFERKLRR